MNEDLNKYREIVETAIEGICTLNYDGIILYINGSAANILGAKAANLIGKNLLDVKPGRIAEEHLKEVRGVIQSGKGRLFNAVIDFSGAKQIYSTSLRPLKNPDGNIDSVICVAHDITDIASMRDDLDSERSFIRTLLDTANSLIVCLDENAHITVFNRECERVTGFSSEEVLGKSWPDIFLPNSHHHHQLADFAQWVRQNPSDKYEGPLKTKSGEIKTILWSNSALFGPDSDKITAIAVGQDITDRIKMENAWQESESRFMEALQNSRDIMYRLNLETMTYDYMSASVMDIIGYSPEEIIERGNSNMRSLVHPDDLKRLKDHRKNLIKTQPAGGHSSITEYRMKSRDGHYIWLSDSHTVVHDRTGKPQFIIGNVRDISNRKKIEEALRENQEGLERRVDKRTAELKIANIHLKQEIENRKTIEKALRTSEKRYEMATNAGQVGVWDWNLKTNEIYIDPKLKAMLGYKDDEIKNHLDDWMRHVHPDDIEKVGIEADKHFRDETPQFEIVHRMLHRDGGIRWILARANAVRDEAGQPIRMVGTDTDITDRRLAEIELLETRQRLGHLISSSPAVIYSCGAAPDFPTTFISDNITERLGYKPQDFYDDPFFWSKQIHPDDHDRIMGILAKINGPQSLSYEYRFRRKDKKYVWLFDELTVTADDEGRITGIIGSWFDISPRKNAEELLQKTADELRNERELLAEKNIALKQILGHIESERESYKQQICENIEYAIKPVLLDIRDKLGKSNKKEVDLLLGKVYSILTKDIDVFRDRFSRLTPREIEICELLRKNMSSKQISSKLNLAVVTIHKHREQIRKKLGLTGKDINLITFLQNHWPDKYTQ